LTETQKYTIGITHGVITEELPDSHVEIGPDWALQHPMDYYNVLKRAVPKIMRESQVNPSQVIGIGVDFTGSTVIPTTNTGTPLALIEEYHDKPHAWPKLWKHHAAQDKADRMTQLGQNGSFPKFGRFMMNLHQFTVQQIESLKLQIGLCGN